MTLASVSSSAKCPMVNTEMYRVSSSWNSLPPIYGEWAASHLWASMGSLQVPAPWGSAAEKPISPSRGCPPVWRLSEVGVECKWPSHFNPMRDALVGKTPSRAQGSSVDGGFVETASQFHFCLCPVLPASPLFHRGWSQINPLHPRLHLSICFWRIQSVP